ncbi:MAG TPA: aminotransferase class IV [Jiangellaceae bacterium]
MRTWVNGRLTDAEDAVVNVFDHGLTVGDGVFETVKVVDGVPFALGRHIDRLSRSATGLELPEPDAAEVRAATEAVSAQVPVGLHRLRITYTGGVSPLGSERGEAGPTLVVAIAPTTPPAESTAVGIVPWPRNEKGALAGLKTTSYGENVKALAHARRLGGSEAIFADTQGRLCEGTGSNVFVVVDGEVITPTLETGCLAGITRALVLEWTGAKEADAPLDVLERADEIFLTSSIRDIQGVSGVLTDTGSRTLSPSPGPITREVAAVFAKRSAEDPEP